MNSAEARELRSMQRELTKMQTELAITQRELNRKKVAAPGLTAGAAIAAASVPAAAPSVGGAEAAVEESTDYETLRKRYDALLTKQGQLERTQFATAGLDPGVFQLVDMPARPGLPVGPNRSKYRMLGIALSLGLALLIAFALEIPKLYAINDDRDVEYYLGVPVIALIPETVTPVEGRSRNLLLGRVGRAMFLALLVSGVVLGMTYMEAFTQIAALLR